MSIRYEVEKNGFLLYANSSNAISADDIIKLENSIIADENIKTGYNSLFDWTQVSRLDIINDDINEILNILIKDQKNIHGRKIAIVARPSVASELSRLIDLISENDRNVNLIFFNDISTAKIWLGID